MAMDNWTKSLLLIIAGVILVYLLYSNTTENFNDVGQVGQRQMANNMINPNMGMMRPGNIASESKYPDMPPTPTGLAQDEMDRYFPQNDYAPPEGDWERGKFFERNRPKSCEYKRSSYSGAMRGDLGPSDWSQYFDQNNNLIGGAQTGSNDNFSPIDETNGDFAVFKSFGGATCGSNQNCDPEDLFDVDKYLPQEVNDDWFEVLPEPISVKNRHLINIAKPIGINTIGASHKNPSYDLRAEPTNPKDVVSPWLQSTIEPDTNIVPIF